MDTTIRLGLPSSSGGLVTAAFNLEAPVMISANSHWDPRRRRFRPPCSRLDELDAALDSAGFTAMAHYGGYRWSIRDYVEFAASYSWTWWAQMDFCCEAEVARDRAEVRSRIMHTAVSYAATMDEVRRLRDLGATWLQAPVPVLQGRTPDDYLLSAETHCRLNGGLPSFVGLGSVCTRGAQEVIELLCTLDEELPPSVRLHLFGVKGVVLGMVGDDVRHRVASTDSMAWDYAATRDAQARAVSCDIAHRADHMKRWYLQQQQHLGQRARCQTPPDYSVFAGLVG